jgi:hypothetical protein
MRNCEAKEINCVSIVSKLRNTEIDLNKQTHFLGKDLRLEHALDILICRNVNRINFHLTATIKD